MTINRSAVLWSFITLIMLGAACTSTPPTPHPNIEPTEPLPTPVRVTASVTQNPSPATDMPTLPSIVFESDRSGIYEIYAMNTQGQAVMQITDSSVSGAEGNGSPDWSPDGQRIAFSSKRGGDWDVFVLEAGVETNLTLAPGEDDKADWSPDGSRVSFNSRRGGRQWADVFVVDGDGSRLRALSANDDDDREPAWSPNGQEIAYRSFRDGNYDLYIMDIESSASRYLTKTEPPDWNAAPAWSPDGTQIAFESNRDGNWEIYLTDNNGSGARNLTRSSTDDIEPSWSPDGSRLIFTSNRNGNYELYILDISSGAITRLTYDCARDHNADWRRTGDDLDGEPVNTAVAYVLRSANLRSGPGLNFAQVGGAEVDDCLTVTGRSADSQWLHVRTPEGESAWAARALVDLQGDLDAVPVSA